MKKETTKDKSHDIRGQLATIALYSELLSQSKSLGKDEKEMVKKINKAADAITRLMK